MKVKVKVYDGVKYNKGSEKVAEVLGRCPFDKKKKK